MKRASPAERLALQVASARPLWRAAAPTPQPNTLFSRRRVRELRGHVQRMAHDDPGLLMRLAERRIGGVRDWEYGTLLGALLAEPDRSRWQALDVGSGVGTFPHYLLASANVGAMTTLDLATPLERPISRAAKRGRPVEVRHDVGSMLSLPYDDESFDLVTCISAIEHLDGDRLHDELPPYGEYLERTRVALREMARVVRAGGLLYVTSDAYLPDRQRTDAWSSPRGDGPIWSAYRLGDIEAAFVATVRASGLELVGEPDYDVRLLDDPDRSTYRGRYFTTFAVLARRP